MNDTALIEEQFRSQWGQDKFIYENLMPFRDGTFFEAGAYEGEALSNTYFFERAMGWRGILVEMQQRFIAGMRQRRPRSVVFPCGLDQRPTKLLYFDAGDRSRLLRYLEPTEVALLEMTYRDIEPKPDFRVLWVDVRTVADVVAEADIRHIDYFSLDVEGSEVAVLNSIDFDRLTVDLFTVEDNELKWHEHRKVLEPLGYRLLGQMNGDAFFLHERYVERLAEEHGPGYLDGVCGKLTPVA